MSHAFTQKLDAPDQPNKYQQIAGPMMRRTMQISIAADPVARAAAEKKLDDAMADKKAFAKQRSGKIAWDKYYYYSDSGDGKTKHCHLISQKGKTRPAMDTQNTFKEMEEIMQKTLNEEGGKLSAAERWCKEDGTATRAAFRFWGPQSDGPGTLPINNKLPGFGKPEMSCNPGCFPGGIHRTFTEQRACYADEFAPPKPARLQPKPNPRLIPFYARNLGPKECSVCGTQMGRRCVCKDTLQWM